MILLKQIRNELKSTTDTPYMAELTSLQNEQTGLVALEYQMDRNVESMKRLRAHAQYSRTVQGRALQWAGRLFALYCVFRTLSVSTIHPETLLFESTEPWYFSPS